MANDVHSFWRDKAKLDLLSPEKRWQFYIRSIGMVIPTVAGVAIVIAKTSTDQLLLAGLLASMVYPGCVIAELVFKGGKAGAELMDELAASHSAGAEKLATIANSPPDIRRVKEAMYDLFSSIHGAAGGVYAPGLNLDQWNGKAEQFVRTTLVKRHRDAFAKLERYTGSDEDFRVKDRADKRAGWLRELHDKITVDDVDPQCKAADIENWLSSR